MTQYARPNADISISQWTGSYADIDEVTANDADKLTSVNHTNGTARFTLSSVSDPSSSADHALRWRGRKTASGGHTRGITVELCQDATVIASQAVTDMPAVWTDYELTLTAAQSDSITDYNALCVNVTSTGELGTPYSQRRVVECSWIEFAVPNVGSTVKTVTDTGAGADVLGGIRARLGVPDTATGIDPTPGQQASLDVPDASSGADALAQLWAALGVVDTSLHDEALALSAVLAVADSSAASDAPGVVVVLSVADAAHGADLVNLFTALYARVADTGTGVELVGVNVTAGVLDAAAAVDLIAPLGTALAVGDSAQGQEATVTTVRLTVDDTGTGGSALHLTTSFAVSDAGAGSDALSVLTPALKAICDMAVGSDALGGCCVTALIADSGGGNDATRIGVVVKVVEQSVGVDTPHLTIALAVSDNVLGTDAVNLLAAALKTIHDVVASSDFVGRVTVRVPVADTGGGSDTLDQLLAAVVVWDALTAVEVVTPGTGVRIVSLTFAFTTRDVAWKHAAREIEFAHKTRSIDFTMAE